MNENSKSKLRAMGAKISTWKRQPNSCAAAQCWKCGCRIRLGKMVYERREEVSDFRGDDKVSWACVPCMTRQEADAARAQRDDFIRQLAEAVAEQGRLQTQLRDANAAGVVLAKEAHHSRKCWIVTNSEYTVPSENVDALADARVETDENPTAAAWLAKAKEQATHG